MIYIVLDIIFIGAFGYFLRGLLGVLRLNKKQYMPIDEVLGKMFLTAVTGIGVLFCTLEILMPLMK